LLFDEFQSDPAIREAGERMLNAFSAHQNRITGIKAADPARKAAADETMRAFSAIRGTDLYFPYLGSGFGRGPFVELIDGSVKYDFIAGIGVHYLGHGHPVVVRAALEGALQNTVMQGNLQQNAQTHEFMQLLLSAARGTGAPLEHCFLTTS